MEIIRETDCCLDRTHSLVAFQNKRRWGEIKKPVVVKSNRLGCVLFPQLGTASVYCEVLLHNSRICPKGNKFNRDGQAREASRTILGGWGRGRRAGGCRRSGATQLCRRGRFSSAGVWRSRIRPAARRGLCPRRSSRTPRISARSRR